MNEKKTVPDPVFTSLYCALIYTEEKGDKNGVGDGFYLLVFRRRKTSSPTQLRDKNGVGDGFYISLLRIDL